jgi:DNA-binding response OmpR family regulator
MNTIFKRLSKEKDINNTNENILKYKNIVLNLEKKVVLINNKEITLTKNEYELLEKIMSED